MKITSSTKACPAATLGPEVHPNFRDELTVATRVGPGARAPVRPIVKAIAKTSSTPYIRVLYLGLMYLCVAEWFELAKLVVKYEPDGSGGSGHIAPQ